MQCTYENVNWNWLQSCKADETWFYIYETASGNTDDSIDAYLRNILRKLTELQWFKCFFQLVSIIVNINKLMLCRCSVSIEFKTFPINFMFRRPDSSKWIYFCFQRFAQRNVVIIDICLRCTRKHRCCRDR